MSKIKYSVVVPVFNEAENLRLLHKQIWEVMQKFKQPFEIIYINDGSTDKSGEVINQFKPKEHVALITLRRNLGKSVVYNLGFQKARGEILLTIDSDLQDEPREIPRLVRAIEQGSDFVIGWRRERQDAKSKIIGSQLFNKTVNAIFKSNFHDIDCGLKAFTKTSLNGVYLYGDFHRYLPLLLQWNGFKGKEIEIRHHKRKFGDTKYSYWKILNSMYDLFSAWFIFRFAQKPMHFFGFVGLGLLTIGMLINLYLVLLKLVGEAIGGRPLLFLGILLTLSGIQFITTGFIADLVVRCRTHTNLDSYIRE